MLGGGVVVAHEVDGERGLLAGRADRVEGSLRGPHRLQIQVIYFMSQSCHSPSPSISCHSHSHGLSCPGMSCHSHSHGISVLIVH